MNIYKFTFRFCLAGAAFVLFCIAKYWSDWPDMKQNMAVIGLLVQIVLAATYYDKAKILVKENQIVTRHDPNGCRRITELAPDETA